MSSSLDRIIKAALFTPSPEGFWGLPVFLWGPPGVGKTHIVKALAKRYNLPLERLSPGERGEGQFGVIGVPNKDGFLDYPAPAWARKLKDGGILFVDELNTAPPSLQAPLLGLIQLRVLGSHEFGSRVRTIAAANETKHAAGGWDVGAALRNRFAHLQVEGLEASDWCVSLLGGFAAESDVVTDALVEEARVMSLWPDADAKARGLIAGFIARRPELLQAEPAKGADTRAWPSRRSVDYARAALAGAFCHGLDESETDELLSGFVGQAWVAEFRTWTVEADLPDPVDVVTGKAKFAHDPRRLDRTVAVLGACAALVAPVQAVDRNKRAGVVWKLIASVLDDAADVAVPAARVMAMAHLGTPKIPEALKPLATLSPLLVAAGVVQR